MVWELLFRVYRKFYGSRFFSGEFQGIFFRIIILLILTRDRFGDFWEWEVICQVRCGRGIFVLSRRLDLMVLKFFFNLIVRFFYFKLVMSFFSIFFFLDRFFIRFFFICVVCVCICLFYDGSLLFLGQFIFRSILFRFWDLCFLGIVLEYFIIVL